MADDENNNDEGIDPIILEDLGFSLIPMTDEGAETAAELAELIEIGRAEWEKQLYVKGGGKLN
jgi:hypothetical protein